MEFIIIIFTHIAIVDYQTRYSQRFSVVLSMFSSSGISLTDLVGEALRLAHFAHGAHVAATLAGHMLLVLEEAQVTQTCNQRNTDDDQRDDPPNGLVCGGWRGRRGRSEGIRAFRQGLISDVGVVERILVLVNDGALEWWIVVQVVFENSEEFLEEHAAENNLVRLRVERVEVADLELALLVSPDVHLLCEGADRHAHVVAGCCGEVETESVRLETRVLSARVGQGANAILGSLAENVSFEELLEVGGHVLVDVSWETDSLEVGREDHFTVRGHSDEVLRRVDAIGLVDDAHFQAGKLIVVLEVRVSRDSHSRLVGVGRIVRTAESDVAWVVRTCEAHTTKRNRVGDDVCDWISETTPQVRGRSHTDHTERTVFIKQPVVSGNGVHRPNLDELASVLDAD